MGTDRLIENELPQWVKSKRRHAHFSQSIETEELADAELDVQMEIIAGMSAKPSESPVEMLLKLKLWENSVAPDGQTEDLNAETQLIVSVIKDLESFVASNGASMATYPDAEYARVS